MEEWDVGPVYLEITSKNQVTHLSYHMAWHRKRFIERVREAHFKEGSTMVVLTKQEYQDKKWGATPHGAN